MTTARLSLVFAVLISLVIAANARAALIETSDSINDTDNDITRLHNGMRSVSTGLDAGRKMNRPMVGRT